MVHWVLQVAHEQWVVAEHWLLQVAEQWVVAQHWLLLVVKLVVSVPLTSTAVALALLEQSLHIPAVRLVVPVPLPQRQEEQKRGSRRTYSKRPRLP